MKKLTKEEIKSEAENLIEQFYKGESRASAFGLGFVTGADWAQKQLLQQTDCYTALELLQQMLKELQKLNAAGYEDFKDLMKGSENERALQRVIRLIGERQANAV